MLTKSHKIRSGLVLAGFIVCFSTIVARLFSIQVLQHDYYVERGKRIYETRELIYPKRGSILDRNLKVLALSEPTKIICADLRKIQDQEVTPSPGRLAGVLARILDLDSERLRRTFALRGRQAVYLKRKPAQEVIDAVEALRRDRGFFQGDKGSYSTDREFMYPGIFFDDRIRRVYPDGKLLCHVLGFVRDEPRPGKVLVRDDSYPVAGVERSAHEYLRGEMGWRMKNIDNRRRWVISPKLVEKAAVNGQDVVLTIDENIQFVCEEEIRRQFEDVPCKTITAIVVDPRSGEILALANYPDFDPNNIIDFDPEKMSNHAMEYSFEPGSTFKGVTAALALEAGVVTLEEVVDCGPGYWRAPKGPLLHDYTPQHKKTFEQVVVKSSNIGMAKVCGRLGAKGLYEGLRKFGIGRKTGIPLPGEIAGTLRPPHLWTGYSLAEVPMGQEVAVTPLQLAMAFGAIANDGVLMKPLIIKEIKDEAGQVVKSFEPQSVGRAISPKTAKTMKSVLRKVVAQGTGKRAEIKGYSPAGKTGTAQRALPVTDESGQILRWVYSDKVFNSTFCGFAPAQNPRAVILVVLQGTIKPKHFGGTVAAPVFAAIGEKVLQYLQVQPVEEVENTPSASER
jgi:cell division protein FtsI (penicillin-binding protein 3)